MGKGKFDKKQAVRFNLLPGPQRNGKPTVLYHPVESKKTRLSKKERKNIISELSDYDEITINGRKVNEDQIPAYVLEQIRGRKDIVFNQIKGEEEDEGDLYPLQDGKEEEGDQQYEEYEDYDDEEEGHGLEKVEEGREEYSEDEEDWEDEDGDEEEEGSLTEEPLEEQIVEPKPYAHKEEDFPAIQQPEQVQIEGITYTLTKAQAKLLQTVIPENYEQLDFGGLNFKRYNEDGLLISEKAKYQKYFLKEDEKVVIIDSYEHVPAKPVDIIDNDFKPSQINGNRNVKEIQEALDYDGEEKAYDELEDDFFAKMIQAELADNTNKDKPKEKPKEQPKETSIKPAPKAQPKPPKEIKLEVKGEQLDQQLEKALFNYEHNIEEGHPQEHNDQQDEEEQEEQVNSGEKSMNFTDLQKREEYIGRDGELDWRCLTRKEKKEYMKTKVIREFYDQLRERELQDKLKGKMNVTPEQLHLKALVKHIPYEEDHVMQKALEEELKVNVDIDQPLSSDDSLSSEEDDIVSFHQKTSIIASNLSVIQEPRKPKPQKVKQEPAQEDSLFKKVKVVPEQRKREETAEERKERKEKLKAQKKEKKEQKREFAEKFSKIKKQNARQENPNNPLNKVSYVKLY